MARALELSLEAPRGPVQLMVTGAVLAARLSGSDAANLPSAEPTTLDDTALLALVALAAQLTAARRPVLYAGRAVIDAGGVDDFRRLAEALGAAVFTDESARGILDERHPLSVGTASHREAESVLAAGDICVAIGARFSQWSTRDWSLNLPAPLYRIDGWAAPAAPKYQIEGQIVGDIGLSLRALRGLIGANSGSDENAGTIAAAGVRARQAIDAQLAETSRPDAHPAAVLRAIRAAMPENAIAVVDGSSTGTWAAEDIFPVYQPHGFLTPEVLKELGSAIMVGMGAKLAAPDRPVVVIQGDGGFLFQAGELATLARENIPLCIVIFNDGHYNADRLLLEHMFDGDRTGCALRNPDFVALAAAFGLDAARAQTPTAIEQAVGDAIRSGRPTLIDIPIDPGPAPYRLQAVFDALKAKSGSEPLAQSSALTAL